jgi:hypothetical protein
MNRQPFLPLSLVVALMLFSATIFAQNNIEWSKDTIAMNEAIGARSTYVNTIRGSGQKATERINLPVAKLKSILDACASQGLTEVSVMVVVIRQQDIARYRRAHPETTATDDQIRGSQILVFKVPRSAFPGPKSSKVNLSNNPMLLSMLSLGLVLLDQPFDKAAGTDDLYFSLGTICPPPASCD